MKIDIVTTKQLKQLEESTLMSLRNVNTRLLELYNMLLQLGDRIQILERKVKE